MREGVGMNEASATGRANARESVQLNERARKTCTVILQALTSAGQKTVADALGVSVSTVSRMAKDGEFDIMAATLTALGLKAVPVEARYVSERWLEKTTDRIRGLEYYAEKGMQAEKGKPLIETHPLDDAVTDIHWSTGGGR